jgi:hypothetical protein
LRHEICNHLGRAVGAKIGDIATPRGFSLLLRPAKLLFASTISFFSHGSLRSALTWMLMLICAFLGDGLGRQLSALRSARENRADGYANPSVFARSA